MSGRYGGKVGYHLHKKEIKDSDIWHCPKCDSTNLTQTNEPTLPWEIQTFLCRDCKHVWNDAEVPE